MKVYKESQLKKDLLKLAFLFSAVIGMGAIFVLTPELSHLVLASLVITTLLSPWVAAFERQGHSRSLAIGIIFILVGLVIGLVGFLGIQIGLTEWDSFKEKAPEQFRLAMSQLRKWESHLKSHYSFLHSIHPTDSVLGWGAETGRWFVDHGASLMGEILSWIFLLPPFVFVLLKDGRTIRRRFFQLVPNRYFESAFLITNDISVAISDYIRAKMLEALLVGIMVVVGLGLIKAPYALVLGIAAGITNIIPYLGPIFGVIPAILACGFDSSSNTGIYSVLLVYLIANLVDMIVIFPLVVAKLVDLHPLILIGIVAVGQHYYGLVGMLISVPIAAAIKVVIQEIHRWIYSQN